MSLHDDDFSSVLEAVREVVPKLRENALEAEERRWIPDENIALLEKADVFRIAVPRKFGGLDLPLAQQYAVLAESSRGAARRRVRARGHHHPRLCTRACGRAAPPRLPEPVVERVQGTR